MSISSESTTSALARGRTVQPKPITGSESPEELLASAFPAFVGRQVRTAFELMVRSIEDQHTTFLTLSGAMTPAGLHRSCIVPMIEAGHIDVLTTTGANLYHDAHRVIGHRIHEIQPDAGDTRLREARIIRIYDLGFDERVLLETDQLFSQLLQRPEMQRKMTSVELHHLLGKSIADIEDAIGVDQHCLLSACYRNAVPIFVGAPQDGSIFLNVVKLKALLGDEFGFELDVAQDVLDMAALQLKAQREGKTSIWILGGGVPKNFTLQGEPTLSQIFEVQARGFDVDVQFCVDPVDNGALSSCPAGEGHTWGKVSADCVQSSSVYVHTDVTAVLPWLVHGLLAKGLQKQSSRWYEQVPSCRAMLHDELSKSRDHLVAGLKQPVHDGEGKALSV